jgi:hypothetical protein
LLAALAPRFGGSVSGDDRSAELPAFTHLITNLRARDGASRVCDGPTGAAPTFFLPYSLAEWRRSRSPSMSAGPLPSHGVSFGNTRFAAALRLAAPIPF